MKTTYTCEVCDKHFTDWQECNNHEKVCEEEHATGIRLARDLSGLLKQAAAAGISILTGCADDPLTLEAVRYEPDKKQIYLAFVD